MPPDLEGGGDPHHQAASHTTNNTSTPQSADEFHSNAITAYAGVATWWRRQRARQRMPVLSCGCVDPWIHRCAEPSTAGYPEAAHHLLTHGLTPAPNMAALRQMWTNGQRLAAETIAERWDLVS